MAYTDIDKPSDYFNTVLYTGDASSPRTISGVGFQPDWNWSKSRNSADYDHNVADSVRGGSAYYLKTNTTAAETACLDNVEFQRARTPVGSLSIRWPYHPMLRRKWQRGFAAKRYGMLRYSDFW